MKVTMLEWYQDAYVVLKPQQVAKVDEPLGKWLIENRKAVLVEEEKPEPKPQHIETPKRAKGKAHESDNSISND